MKRHNHLFERILDLDNLYLAYWKARRGKEANSDVLRYSENLRENLLNLREELLNGNVETGGFRSFKIFDPKERLICAAPFSQRVMHHALMNVCTPIMDSCQIFDSYANRKGKGTFAAIERARKFHRRYDWCVKLDVRKYFDSIDHAVLQVQLERLFKEKSLLSIFRDIINSYEVTKGKGLPIGNLTSQYCANHYLASADHYLKEVVGVKAYVRYMDDVLMYGSGSESLLEQAKCFRSFIAEKLDLSLKVFDMKPTTCSVQFLGFRITRSKLLLSRRSMQRYREKLRLYHRCYDLGVWNDADLFRHLQPVLAFACKADSRNFRKGVQLYR